MNKMKKLLSVLLAVVMILSSMTVLASAARTNYKTVEDLVALDAYSPYGKVTRLSTEERMSITMDYLDNVLAQLNINPGRLFNLAGLSLTVNLTSVDALCGTLDNVKSLKSNFLITIIGGLLGIVGQLDMGSWTSGMTRDKNDQLKIVSDLLAVLADNKGIISDLVKTGKLDLGLASSAVKGLDLSIIADIPGLIKGMVFPMLERKDDTQQEVKDLDSAMTGNGKVESTLVKFVKDLFTNNMSSTTVKADANGNITSNHNLPGEGSDSRYYYVIDGNTLTVYHYVDAAEAKASEKTETPLTAYTYVAEEQTYTLTKEPGTDDYVWTATNEDGARWNLKWYEEDSQFLPSLTATIDISAMSLSELLYTFAPVVFGEMAPVVLNGSVKKIVGGLFGVKYNYVGDVGSDEVNALADSSNTFFTQEQGEYLWEWSDYAVINGNHYYRFQDQIFAADISNANPYFNIVNWDYKITADFMDEFIPANGGSTSDTILMNLNDFLVKVVNTVLSDEILSKVSLASGANSNLVANIKAVAQEVISYNPASIFGSDYDTNPRCYYNMLMSSDNQTILTGIAATAVDMLMPQMLLPTVDELMAQNTSVGAILAAVVREFVTNLLPENNYDNLIYVDYGTSTSDNVKTFLSGKDNSYWLDVILTMGIDIGYEYLVAFADMGGKYETLASNGAGLKRGNTWAAGTSQAELNAYWEGLLDYLIDWALSNANEWTFSMENLVNTTGLTIDLDTAQDPWEKLDHIFYSLLPIDQILNVTANDCDTRLEQLLRYDLILSLVDLEWENVVNLLVVPEGFARQTNVLDSLAGVLKTLINGLFAKVGGGSYALLPAAMTDLDTLANQNNIATLLNNLLGALPTAFNNGLLQTVLPILGYFIGWKMDAQVMADPEISTSFRDGDDYAFQYTGNGVYPKIDSENTIINFLNNSSGMLEKHPDADVDDHAYEIKILKVESDATVNTLTFDYGDGIASPYETLPIKIGGTYNGEEAVTITITYQFTGKDGQPTGPNLYESITVLFSNQYEDANISGRQSGDDSSDYAGIDDFGRYQFTEDIYTTVTEFEPVIFSTTGGVLGTSTQATSFDHVTAPERSDNGTSCDTSDDYDIDMNAKAKQYFAYYQNRDGGWGTEKPKEGSTSGKLYYAKAGVTKATIGNDYGVYDMGQVAVKYGSDSKVWRITYIYYNDYDIQEFVEPYVDMGITMYDVNRNSSAAVAAYNTYNTALKNAVKLATYPMMTEANGNAATDYVTTIMPQIPDAKKALENAYKALTKFIAEANGAAGADANIPSYVSDLEVQLALDDNDGEKEVNFQDYDFYEYFSYADLRTEARNLDKTYYAPEVMDTYYIEGSGIREAELNNVIEAENNSVIAAGIAASRMKNDDKAIADSITAREEWEMPINSPLYVEDMTARLAYYKNFVEDAGTACKAYLEKELAYAAAQQYNEADYTAASWANYAEKLAYAQSVVAGTAEYANYNSTIFEAKYNLMVAEKNLLKKADSLIEQGGTADLLANIDIAEAIFASLGAADGEWVVKDGVNADKAYADLIKALGYYYTGENGVEYNLYEDSAYEYRDNDRPNRSSNQNRVNASNAALEAAIALFEKVQSYLEPVISGILTGVVDEVNKYVYGVDLSSIVDNFFEVANGTMNLVANAAGYTNGTGAKLEVIDTNGDVAETYTLIVFGDVNGDGDVTGADYTVALNAAGGADIADEAADFAGDVNGDGSVTGADYTVILNAAGGAGITVNPYEE